MIYIKSNVLVLQIVAANVAEMFSIRSRTSGLASNMSYQEKCFQDLGCVVLTSEWTHPLHRPKNVLPADRHIINTVFIKWKMKDKDVAPETLGSENINLPQSLRGVKLFVHDFTSNGYTGWIKKEHEQRRRRKSKAQFFEMIQEIRRVQVKNREQSLDSIKEHAVVETPDVSEELTESKFLSPSPEVPSRSPRQGRSPRQLRSPRGRRKRCSLAGLNVRRFSTDSVLGSDSTSIYERTSLNIGRRLSRDVSFLTSSPPDINTRLRTPSPMVRRPEGSSTRSYQDVSDRSDNYLSIDGPTPRASVEIMVSGEHVAPSAPPCPRASPAGARSELSLLSEEELIRLWRSSEREVREALLQALQEKQGVLDAKQDPG